MNRYNVSVFLAALFFLFASCEVEPELLHPSPSDPAITEQAAALFHSLNEVREEAILFGHQDALAYGVHWINEPGRSDVKEVTGDYPAVYGWELGDLELGAEENLDGVNFDNIRGWIQEGYERGGVITISWHKNNPVTGGDAWDTEGEVIPQILPGGEHHETYNEWLDRFAEFTDDLRVEVNGEYQKIPFIFRPFHESSGSWFWWGEDFSSPEEYIDIWQYTVDYLRDEQGLDHMLMAYSPDRYEDADHYMERYPGDEYVDIMGYDNYHHIHEYEDHDHLRDQLGTVVELAEQRNKIPAFTETGQEALPDDQWFTDKLYNAIAEDPVTHRIAYVQVWRNANAEHDREDHFYAPYPGHPAEEDFIRFYEKPDIFFESDLPAMYTVGED